VEPSEYGAPHFIPESGDGIYETTPDRQLISASSVVVSYLLSVNGVAPGGTDGETWISAIVEVPSGRQVTLFNLHASPSKALDAIASDVIAAILVGQSEDGSDRFHDKEEPRTSQRVDHRPNIARHVQVVEFLVAAPRPGSIVVSVFAIETNAH